MQTEMTSLLAQAEQLQRDGRDIDDILVFLRAQGCSKIDSIKLLMQLSNLTLAEAKERVHCSRAWDDTRAADEALHEALDEAIEQVARRA
jgi:ribosomal protein L7/L12